MKKSLIFILVASVFSVAAWAATNSVTYTDLHNVKTATFTFSNLNVINHVPSAPTNDLSCIVTSKVLSGTIERVVLVSLNSTNVTAAMTLTLTDDDGVDLFRGVASALSTNVPQSFIPGDVLTNVLGRTYAPVSFESKLVLTVTNFAGKATTNLGVLKLYYRE